MPKKNTPERKQAPGTPQAGAAASSTQAQKQYPPVPAVPAPAKSTQAQKQSPAIPTVPAPAKKTSRPAGKGARPQVGGTAVQGAKSTLPKQVSQGNNPQQQEVESYNRTMRRRMEQLGTGPAASDQKKVKTMQERRKERIERIKERKAAQLATVKRSLPGGKISTDTRRVYFLIAGIALAIVLLIVVFVILRATGVLHS